jgi:cation diffusion facilitator family transporter
MHTHSHGVVHKAALTSLIAALFLTTFKIVIGFQTNSLGILAEAAHSALDLVAAAVTFWAVKISAKPADQDHHFGHGKVENISSLVETFLLWITCGWIAFEAFNRLFGHSQHAEIQANFWAFLALTISIIVDFNRSRVLNKVAKECESPALAADALHFQSDIYSSLAVLFGLALVYFGKVSERPILNMADSIAALMVAGWTFIVSLKLVRESIDQLMDKAPHGAEDKILALLHEIPEVLVISSLKVRKSGPSVFINLTVGLDKKMSFESAHLVTDCIEDKIKEAFRAASISVHAEPI